MSLLNPEAKKEGEVINRATKNLEYLALDLLTNGALTPSASKPLLRVNHLLVIRQALVS